MSWREVFPPELHESIEKSLRGAEEDGYEYISIIPDLQAVDVNILLSVLTQQIADYGETMLDNTFKYEMTHVLMDIILAHRDNPLMMNIYHQISAYSDRHNRNLLHLALLFVRYDFLDLTLDHTEPALLAQLILSEYNTKYFTVIDQAVDHGQIELLPKILSKISADQLADYFLSDETRPSLLLHTYEYSDEGLELLLEKLSESTDKSVCEKIILLPHYNLLEKCIELEDMDTVDMIQRYLNTNKKMKFG